MQTMQALDQYRDDEKTVDQLQKNCSEFKRLHANQPSNRVTVDRFTDLFNSSPEFRTAWQSLTPTSMAFLERQILPQSICKGAGPVLGVGLGANGTAGFKVTHCINTQGKNWIEIDPNVSYGLGLGASITVEEGTFEDLDDAPSDWERIDTAIGGALGVGGSETELRAGRQAGYGVGLAGWIDQDGAQKRIRAISLGRKPEILIDIFHLENSTHRHLHFLDFSNPDPWYPRLLRQVSIP
jgi:hypothetical protein